MSRYKGKTIYLKRLTSEAVTQDYVEWLKDEEVTQYLECRWQAPKLEGLKAYVQQMAESTQDYLFGIYLNSNNNHIGNIKIGAINQLHRFGDIGLFIGDKNMWGKGIAVEAISLATKYAFLELNLHKLIAGIYDGNQRSTKAFLRNGYRECGRLKEQRFYQGNYVDEILVEILKSEWKKTND